jgi:hypothetical protein
MVRQEEYRHLSPQVWEDAARPATERMATVGGHCWIGYPAAQAAIARLEHLLAQPPVLRPPNLLIVGPTNNGKSMIAERFRRIHPPGMSANREHQHIPVLAMQMPSNATIRRFYAALLVALGSPLLTSGTTDLREQHALRTMRQVGVRILMIDELHNILAARPGQQREFLNLLRFIGNELRLSLCCLGTKESYLAIRSDDQLENRFEPVSLPRWTDGVDLGRLLTSFEATLPLREPSGLSSPALRALILRRSEGTIGEIATLLSAATRKALATGRERIDADTILAADYQGPSERRQQFEASLG